MMRHICYLAIFLAQWITRINAAVCIVPGYTSPVCRRGDHNDNPLCGEGYVHVKQVNIQPSQECAVDNRFCCIKQSELKTCMVANHSEAVCVHSNTTGQAQCGPGKVHAKSVGVKPEIECDFTNWYCCINGAAYATSTQSTSNATTLPPTQHPTPPPTLLPPLTSSSPAANASTAAPAASSSSKH